MCASERRQKLGDLLLHRLPLEERHAKHAADELSAEKHVLGDRQILPEREFLEDRGDPDVRRVLGRSQTDGCPVEQQRPSARLIGARQDLDEGRFAGSVVAENRQNLSCMDVHIDIDEGLQGAEALGDRPG